MNKRIGFYLIALIPVLLFAFFFINRKSENQELVSVPVLTATLNEIDGDVKFLDPAVGVLEPATEGMEIKINYQVVTGENSRVMITLSSGTIIRLSPFTSFFLEELTTTENNEPFANLKLIAGEVWIILNGGQVDVDTASGLASVRGSYLSVTFDPLTGETSITCLEGECTLGNGEGSITIVAGQTAYVSGSTTHPTGGLMTDEEVNNWLNTNPEATVVVEEMKATVAVIASPTEIPTETPSITPSSTNTEIPTSTDTATAIPPTPTFTYIPPTYTPIPPTNTKTPKPPTNTPEPTLDPNRTIFTPVELPPDLSSLDYCFIDFDIDVEDANGVLMVLLAFTINDPTFAEPEFVELFTGESTSYYESVFFENIQDDVIYWTILAADDLENPDTYFDDGYLYSFTITVDCSPQ